MTTRTLILRSLRFHARSHVGTLLGAAIGTAVLVGALVVGDSVRGSLREMALQRLAGASVAINSGDRFFSASLLDRLLPVANKFGTRSTNHSASLPYQIGWFSRETKLGSALLSLPATGTSQDGTARANQINLLGVEDSFFQPPISLAPSLVWLNEPLAEHLHARVGDHLIFRFPKPSALSSDAVITPRSAQSVAMRLEVAGTVPRSRGNFSLTVGQVPRLNAFVPLRTLATIAGVDGRANVLIAVSAEKVFKPSLLERVLWSVRSWLQSRELRTEEWNHMANFSRVTAEESKGVLETALKEVWQLSDAELEVLVLNSSTVQLNTRRIFLDPSVVEGVYKANARTPTVSNSTFDLQSGIGVLTYLVNLIQAGDRTTPYSMITATSAPWVPSDMGDDEILVNEWLAEDLAVKPGDSIQLTYYLADSASTLTERTNTFRVRSIVPMSGIYADRTLMPDFPGIAKAESTHEWDAAFPLIHKIRDKDEAYWKQYRGTPKAFITLAAGQKMWANRFGNLTAIRWFPTNGISAEQLASLVQTNLHTNLDPASVGLKFEPVRDRALKAVEQSQDFGGLFIGFSFFLIAAALALMWLLFQFGVEQRATEVGTLLALGFTPKQVRRLLLLEGTALALTGGVLGVVTGTAYARAMLRGLSTVWRNAVGTWSLQYHAEPLTLVIGAVSGFVIALLTIWLALRKQAGQPARELLAEGAEERRERMEDGAWKGRWGLVISGVTAAAAFVLVTLGLVNDQASNPGSFFVAGALLLIAGLLLSSVLLQRLRTRASVLPSLNDLSFRNAARRRKRSLAVIGSLACGSFLIASIGAFRLDANADATKRSSGTGGFAFIGQSTLPIVKDLNTEAGLDHYGLDSKELAGVRFVPFRVREGDEASCLNLNRAQQPRLLGVKPEMLSARKAFTFAKVAKGLSKEDPWLLLNQPQTDGSVPAIGDAASIQWALGKKVGDTIDYTDERGQTFKAKLVGAVANSILQGNLIIAEDEFTKRFPSAGGYRMFLIDAPSKDALSATLTRALQDVGFELTPATVRLAQFNAVQNTYLNTFQVLGGLGLLLGSAGLGVVVLRNVLERRGELALLLAVGFRRRTVKWTVVNEHGALLLAGLGIGVLAALVAVLPALLTPGGEFPYGSLALTLGAVLASGAVWTWVAASLALRGRLLDALRNE